METTQSTWQHYTEAEKEAYLSAITLVATAGREANESEVNYIRDLAHRLNLSFEQAERIEQVARHTSTSQLANYLETLRGSELKYSFIADIVSYAQSDGVYTDEEESRIRQLSTYLNVTPEQYTALERFVHSAQSSYDGERSSLSTDLEGSFQQVGISGATLNHMLQAVLPLWSNPSTQAGYATNASSSDSAQIPAVEQEILDDIETPDDRRGSRAGQASGGEASGRAGSLFARFNGRNGYQGLGSAFDGVFGSGRRY